MTKEEFIASYCAGSGVTWDELSKRRVALPCECGNTGCHGWAMIPNDPEAIDTHNRLHGPGKPSGDANG